MSASSKKKLRNQQESAKMTERQLQEQKEAKKLKLYTSVFVVVLALLLVSAVVLAVTRAIDKSGVLEKNTVAMTVGEHKINNVQMNYFFIDYVSNFYNEMGIYASFMGLDASKPLDEQYVNEETGYTWADDFLVAAKGSAKTVYALADAAAAEGYTLSETDLANIDNTIANMTYQGMLYYGTNFEGYLKMAYGNAASEESYREYLELTTLASSFSAAYSDSLSFDDAAIRAEEAENYNAFSSYSYNYYYLPATSFREGGTTDADGKTTYSSEEIEASVAAAEKAAKSLAGGKYATVEELDAAIKALPINEGKDFAASTAMDRILYTSVNESMIEWISDSKRAEGDIGMVPYTVTSTDEAGNETTATEGYYVIFFRAVDHNTDPMVNVRHVLIKPEGGTYNSNTGLYDYTEEEIAAAAEEATKLLNEWKDGKAIQDTFIQLAKDHSADGSAENGGLISDIHPDSSLVESFLNWSVDKSRQIGDVDVITSIYGAHIMYFDSYSETTYRDSLIEDHLVSEAYNEWYNAIIEAAVVTDGDTRYVATDLILNNQ